MARQILSAAEIDQFNAFTRDSSAADVLAKPIGNPDREADARRLAAAHEGLTIEAARNLVMFWAINGVRYLGT